MIYHKPLLKNNINFQLFNINLFDLKINDIFTKIKKLSIF